MKEDSAYAIFLFIFGFFLAFIGFIIGIIDLVKLTRVLIFLLPFIIAFVFYALGFCIYYLRRIIIHQERIHKNNLDTNKELNEKLVKVLKELHEIKNINSDYKEQSHL